MCLEANANACDQRISANHEVVFEVVTVFSLHIDRTRNLLFHASAQVPLAIAAVASFGGVTTGAEQTGAFTGLHAKASGGAEGNVLVELTRIATLDARPILLVAADQREAVAHWQQSRLWRSLPLTSRYPLALIEQPISDAGALITAGRFADIFSQLMAGWRDA